MSIQRISPSQTSCASCTCRKRCHQLLDLPSECRFLELVSPASQTCAHSQSGRARGRVAPSSIFALKRCLFDLVGVVEARPVPILPRCRPARLHSGFRTKPPGPLFFPTPCFGAGGLDFGDYHRCLSVPAELSNFAPMFCVRALWRQVALSAVEVIDLIARSGRKWRSPCVTLFSKRCTPAMLSGQFGVSREDILQCACCFVALKGSASLWQHRNTSSRCVSIWGRLQSPPTRRCRSPARCWVLP